MLTELACKNASCPSDKKRARLSDSGNLYLQVASNESKRWFWKYTVGGKEKRLAIGSYPAVKLKDARAARDDARKVLQTGADPTQRRRLDKAKVRATAVTTYEKVAREFHALKQREWSEAHSTKWLRLQESNLFPWIGGLPLGEITANVLLEPLRRVEGKGLNETAVSLRQYAGQVFRYGIATGRCEDDPATKLRGALGAVIVKNMAAVLDPQKAGDLMRAIDGYRGLPATREALLLSALLFQRPGNIRAMEWSWVDFSGSQVVIPAASMKRTKQAKLNGEPHLQACSLLRARVCEKHGADITQCFAFPREACREVEAVSALREQRLLKDAFRLVAASRCGPLNVCCASQSSHLAAHRSASPRQQGGQVCAAQPSARSDFRLLRDR
ncbi:DUF4102 domain-containing protein [Variovorax sp. KBS0712]|uniref:tyrosine-type recombinase/integrase n=1 Tax=Variovorax sp. KBS0712 TaxID=2578111 RepID=UPI00111B812B|nr:integrase arm-type DNA-binding domain-containing protein [Variovorax sp. KBS0712]TSD60548.1 DUF4102 domain-containing protein [Variovorax sp. KBS0712]